MKVFTNNIVLQAHTTILSHQEEFVSKVEEHSKYIEDRITASVYENIPVQALMDWVKETKEKEVHDLEDNMPGSLEECEMELDKHEVIGTYHVGTGHVFWSLSLTSDLQAVFIVPR